MARVWRTLGIVSGLLIPALLPAATHTWTGAVSSLWSDNGNWTGGTPAGDPAADLVFPPSGQLVSTNDIAGVTFVSSITFSGTGYTVNALAGSSIALAGNVSVREATSNVLALPIALYSGTAHSFSRLGLNRDTSSLLVSGVISGTASDPLNLVAVGGFSSGGLFDVTFSGDNTYSGTTTVSSGVPGFLRLFVLGNQPGSAVTGGSISQNAQVSGTGTVGPLTPFFVAPGTAATTGVLHSTGSGQLAHDALFRVRLNGTTVGSQYDQLAVTGAMQLQGTNLEVKLGFAPAVGDNFTILTATGGITGTFEFTEGQIFSADCLNFQIHYTANSVVLTRVAGGGPTLDGVVISTEGSRTTCPTGTAATAVVNDTGGCQNSHQWGFRTVSGIGAITPISGETGIFYSIEGADFPGTGTFYLVETTTPGFGSPVTSNELTVTVVPPPTAVASGSATVCAGSGALLSGSGASSCSWAPAAGLSDPSSCTPLAAPESTATYSLTVMGASGCTSTNTAEVTVTVDPGCTAEIGPLSFYTVPPCRIADTRDPAGTYGGPALSANTDRIFSLVGQCGIPEDARAVALNITVTNPTSAGHLTLHPAGTPLPIASTINFKKNRTRANNAAARLSLAGDLAVFCGLPSGTVDVILDVVGYYQ